MEFDKLDQNQKQELRGVFESLGTPIDDSRGALPFEGERFFGSVVVFLFGASFEHTTRIAGYVPNPAGDAGDMVYRPDAREVSGVAWTMPDESRLVLHVMHLEQAYKYLVEEKDEPKYFFDFSPERIIQMEATIEYLREHFPEDILEDRAHQLLEVIAAIRRRSTD